MDFQTAYRELMLQTPSLPEVLAARLINRSLRDIHDSRLWSFNVCQGIFVSAGSLATGSFNVTQFTSTCTASAAAKTAINAATFPPLTDRQIRFGVPTAAGPTYNITDWNPTTGVLSTDIMYTEATSATSPYQILQCYYAIWTGQEVKVTDFLKFISVIDPITGYKLAFGFTRPEIDQMNPQMSYQGQPYYICQYKYDSLGVPLFELIPSPTTQQRYNVMYQKRGSDLVEGDVLPSIIENAIMELSFYRAAQWAERNVGRYPDLKGVDWRHVMSEHKLALKSELAQAERQDEEIFLQNFIANDQYRNWGPVDSSFMQSHNTDWWG